MVTKKAAAATGSEVQKSVTLTLSESTLENISAAAEKAGAPKDATVSWGNAPYVPAPEGSNEQVFPYQVTFTWSETI